MEKENTQKTREDLIKFIQDEGFVYGDYGDYERNIRTMSDAVQFMGRDWYIEEMGPVLDTSCLYAIADYYDDIIRDVIIFETEIYWRFNESAEEVADYLLEMNERYYYVKAKYESMYTAHDLLKKIFSLFKKN